MKKYAVLIAAALAGCGSEPPVSVELGHNQFGQPDVKITSIIDEVTVKDITLNRGNCKAETRSPLPKTIKFGQSFNAVSACQNLIEISLSTSKGDFDFSFEK